MKWGKQMQLNDKNAIFQLITTSPLGKNDPAKKGNDARLRPGLPRFSGNIFYYWYEFLKLHVEFSGIPSSTSATKVKEVYTDFEVRGSTDFERWWNETGRWLFCDKHETDSASEPVLSPSDFTQLRDGIGIFFPFDGHLPEMLKQAEEAFKAAREAYYKIRPELMKKYALAGKRYELKALHNKLLIYQAVSRQPVEKTFSDIFWDISGDLILERDTRHLTPDYITGFMSENFDDACRLVYHVARGEFPKFAKPQGPYNPRKPWGVYEPRMV
jgi:hypothetical protein